MRAGNPSGDTQNERTLPVHPRKREKPVSATTLPKMLQHLRIAAVPHGFRSSFRDWAAEETDHPREVIEAALADVVQDKVKAAYARSDLFERRRLLMDDWAATPGPPAAPCSRSSHAVPSGSASPSAATAMSGQGLAGTAPTAPPSRIRS